MKRSLFGYAAWLLCAFAPPADAETLTVPPCGSTPALTANSYSGLVAITVSGWMVNTPGNPNIDAFHGLDPSDPSVTVGPDPQWFRYNRQSEGSCLCGAECGATSHPVSDLLAEPYPAFSRHTSTRYYST